MQIIVSDQTEAIEAARTLKKAANSVRLDMSMEEIEQQSLSNMLCAMCDFIVVKSSEE